MPDESLVSRLKPEAIAASRRAYAPYSNLHIGAAVLTDDGSVHTGCNIENASFSLCICAERVALSSAISQLGAKARIEACLIYSSGEQLLSPCGACRQFMAEFLDDEASIVSTCDSESVEHWTIHDLLPGQFTFPADHNGPF